MCPVDSKQNECFLKTQTSPENFLKTGKLKMPLESFTIYSIFKALQIKLVRLTLVHMAEESENYLEFEVKDELKYKPHEMTPWPVQLTLYPCVLHDNTVITGLCAVARHISSHEAVPFCSREHKNGLQGFRNSCLQAPNEVSVWTKFCEIDIFKTALELLERPSLQQIPENLVRFETHLSKPVRIHNIKKIQQTKSKEKMELYAKISPFSNGEVNYFDNESNHLKGEALEKAAAEAMAKTEAKNKAKAKAKTDAQIREKDGLPPILGRIPKTRKWKSASKAKLNSDSCDENLHEFAEGPFFSVADLMLLPQYYIIMQRIGQNVFESFLPLTHKWYSNIMSMPELHIMRDIFNTLILTPLELVNTELPKCEDHSLYKRDPKRNNPKKRLFTKEADIEIALQSLTDGMELPIKENSLEFETINMCELPKFVNPMGGWLPKNRAERKTEQLHNLTLAVMSLAKDGDIIVDFCCGSGHLGLMLAYLLPKCTIILLENKSKSLADAHRRGLFMDLQNIIYFQCNLDFFVGKFDIGIGLHACGIATDLILDKCLKANAKFVLTPCCYGSLHETDRFVYPRSKMFRRLSLDQYMCIGHASDQTHDDQHPLTERGERCMAVIDSDRGHLAKEHGYEVTLTKLYPPTCTPKNNLLIGHPFPRLLEIRT